MLIKPQRDLRDKEAKGFVFALFRPFWRLSYECFIFLSSHPFDARLGFIARKSFFQNFDNLKCIINLEFYFIFALNWMFLFFFIEKVSYAV